MRGEKVNDADGENTQTSRDAINKCGEWGAARRADFVATEVVATGTTQLMAPADAHPTHAQELVKSVKPESTASRVQSIIA